MFEGNNVSEQISELGNLIEESSIVNLYGISENKNDRIDLSDLSEGGHLELKDICNLFFDRRVKNFSEVNVVVCDQDGLVKGNVRFPVK